MINGNLVPTTHPARGSTITYQSRSVPGWTLNAVAEVYRVLCDLADQIALRLQLDHDSISRFGPLGMKFRVMAAVASAYAGQNGLQIDNDAKAQVVSKLGEIRDASLAVLWRDDRAKGCFKSRNGGFKLASTGFLDPRKKALGRWLNQCANELTCLDSDSVRPPSTSERTISTDHSEWEPWTRYHPLLRAWSDSIEASRLRHYFERLEGTLIKPTYKAVPCCRSLAGPGATSLLNRRRRVSPERGHTFLVVTLPDLKLRALSSTLRTSRWGRCNGTTWGCVSSRWRPCTRCRPAPGDSRRPRAVGRFRKKIPAPRPRCREDQRRVTFRLAGRDRAFGHSGACETRVPDYRETDSTDEYPGAFWSRSEACH